ncbi:MAG TPA: aldehyde ferredoxin oxidoreductase C-terminal domain-containing protein [Spirochaetota bacterium]|nr:aldehyde ferredoxin oxidoreductase [Spirochaetota bacterium]HOQ13281.1 aldehyde ferredoxin oxidoreductase C-terminal domain-containing protein [Spirochaetota bacterium]HPX90014.1 aldehyde ferredoxin oxidoreductase C-terminal domain-containing protein [Spirochaetota bacterium]
MPHSNKSYGWTGKILLIDLCTQKYEVIRPEENIYKSFLGGRGLCSYYMREIKNLMPSEIPLLFFPGALTGTKIPFAVKTIISSISPLTKTFFTSAVGGFFGWHLKKAGWDGIIITGKSQNQIGLTVKDENVSFFDCNDLKNKKASDIFHKLKPEGSAAITSIAADNGVAFSNIIIDKYFFAGRGGLGLVMANKGLKAIEVYGSCDIAVHDSENLSKGIEDSMRLVSASPSLMGELGFTEFGTSALYDLIFSRNIMPAKNFAGRSFPEAEHLNAWNFKNKYPWEKTGCPNCPILCKRISSEGLLPEYNSMAHFSSLIDNRDIDIVMEANRLCNETGMDTISAASAIACYRELKDKDHSIDIIQLLKEIAFASGEGKLLIKGSSEFSKKLSSPESSMNVKGLDLPAFDPRGAYGFSLAYATSTRGGCYLQAYPLSHEILRKPIATDRFSFEGKARITKLNEDMNAAMDSLGLCRFSVNAFGLEECAKLLNAVTGEDFTAGDLMNCGERIFYNERIINYTLGFDSKDDDLPERFFESENAINRDDFLKARANYYLIRGLSPEGKPLETKTRELKLKWLE